MLYFFQAAFVLLAFLVATSGRFEWAMTAALLLVAWWFGLAVFRSKDYVDSFSLERRFAEALARRQGDPWRTRLLRAAFRFMYWPIFLSSDFYFWAIVGGGSLIVLIKWYPKAG